MTGEQIAGIVRAIVAAVGGYLVGKGLADAETAATIVAAVWSVLSKKKADPA
jgi:hypothetical protein